MDTPENPTGMTPIQIPAPDPGHSGARRAYESIPPERPRRTLGWVLAISVLGFVAFLVGTGVWMFSKGKGAVTTKTTFSAGVKDAGTDAVGLVELNGVIMDSKKILRKLELLEDDDDVKAIVLRLNSPGGAVAPSQEIYDAVKAFPKPVVASMSSVAASGAFYIACGAKRVFANPGTITGSIGVIMEFANLEKLYEWAKVKRFSIKTGKFKDAGAEYRAMEPDERAHLQGMVDDVLVQFKTAVREGRGLTQEQVDQVADGRIFSGAQAKGLKLVDDLGSIRDAIKAAGELGGIKGKPKVVTTERVRPRFMQLLFDDGEDMEFNEESSAEGLGATLRRGVDALSGLSRAVNKAVPGAGAVNDSRFVEPGIYWLWQSP